jgi:hypothetical protein
VPVRDVGMPGLVEGWVGVYSTVDEHVKGVGWWKGGAGR